MKIAFATIYDPQDVRRGSGTFYHMSKEMERQGHTLHYIGPILFNYPLVSRLLRALHARAGKRYVTYLDPFVGKQTGSEVTRQLANLDYDIVITNDYAIAGYTHTQRPVVLYTDAMITHNHMERNLPHSRMSNISFITLWLSRQTIKRGLRQASLCVFPAQWSADEALKYHPDASKIRVVPFGANMPDPGTEITASRDFAAAKENRTINLLFVGKDWQRKGGAVAVDTVQELQRRGFDAHLHIVGSTPPDSANPAFIHGYGLLDKTDAADMQKMTELYHTCDAFILPSSSEGFVIVPLEAAAYGMPTLAYNTIGVNTTVHDGQTGILLEFGAPGSAFADVIEGWVADPNIYIALAQGARKHFDETVNWKRNIQRLFAEIERVMPAATPGAVA